MREIFRIDYFANLLINIKLASQKDDKLLRLIIKGT